MSRHHHHHHHHHHHPRGSNDHHETLTNATYRHKCTSCCVVVVVVVSELVCHTGPRARERCARHVATKQQRRSRSNERPSTCRPHSRNTTTAVPHHVCYRTCTHGYGATHILDHVDGPHTRHQLERRRDRVRRDAAHGRVRARPAQHQPLQSVDDVPAGHLYVSSSSQTSILS